MAVGPAHPASSPSSPSRGSSLRISDQTHLLLGLDPPGLTCAAPRCPPRARPSTRAVQSLPRAGASVREASTERRRRRSRPGSEQASALAELPGTGWGKEPIRDTAGTRGTGYRGRLVPAACSSGDGGRAPHGPAGTSAGAREATGSRRGPRRPRTTAPGRIRSLSLPAFLVLLRAVRTVSLSLQTRGLT